MAKIKGLIILFISLAIVLGGCGKPTPGYKIYRINDTLLVFLAMEHSSKIVDATLDNKELHVNIDTGKKIEKRVTSLDIKYEYPLIEPNGTVKIHDTNRIKGYGVVHLTVSSPIPRNGSTWFNWSGLQIKGLRKKTGPFKKSGAFRVGDRITAYSYHPEIKKKTMKNSLFWINFDVKYTSTETATVHTFEDGMINIETYNAKSKKLIRKLSFPLDDLQPHETVEVEEKKELGEDIHIAYLKVVPKKNEPVKIIPQRSRPTNQPFIIDR
ncbi:hypothetical protein J4G08_18945 [Candidatus Poribacteria bacterium]|nr:hypothetical protein [Candidatus Poribacteria bacterium]